MCVYRKMKLKLFITLPTLLLLLLFYIFGSHDDDERKNVPLVLLLTPSYGELSLDAWWIEKDTLSNCTYKCMFTTDHSLISSSAAVLFQVNYNVRDPIELLYRSKFPQTQIWGFLHVESPVGFMSDLSEYENMNWTITYRRDSDVHWLSGKLVPEEENAVSNIPTIDTIKNKKLITWMNSNCNTYSERELYVNELSKFIHVDNYGTCFPQKNHCDKKDCYGFLSKKYKFWLVFENAFCNDYVTEKYYKALQYGMVPIVRGHSSFVDIAMDGTYINVHDYDSPEDLAKYIIHLDKNPREYLKYFEWRKHFRSLSQKETAKVNWCNFCTKLHQKPVSHISYTSIHEWFHTNFTNKYQCLI